MFETPGLYDYIQGRAAKKIEIKRCKFLYPVHRYIVQQCAYQPLDVQHSDLGSKRLLQSPQSSDDSQPLLNITINPVGKYVNLT